MNKINFYFKYDNPIPGISSNRFLSKNDIMWLSILHKNLIAPIMLVTDLLPSFLIQAFNSLLRNSTYSKEN
jgi:hypothetical protein